MSCYDIVYDLIVKAECFLTVRIRAKKILPETESESTLFLENRALFSANLGKVSEVHVAVLYILELIKTRINRRPGPSFKETI